MSTNQLAERFGAVAMTLEMPFKDHDANAGCRIRLVAASARKKLAHACLDVLAEVIDDDLTPLTQLDADRAARSAHGPARSEGMPCPPSS